MRKVLLFLYVLMSALLVSCGQLEQYKCYRLDGMWQLKTIEDGSKKITVDSVFYSFQRETVFSYISVPDRAFNPFYGYMNMPSDNKVHVLIDSRMDFNHFLAHSGWSSIDIVFDIKKYDNSNLVLFDEVLGKTYTFKKH